MRVGRAANAGFRVLEGVVRPGPALALAVTIERVAQ